MSDVPKNDAESDTYEEQFIRFANRVEKGLIRFLVTLLVLFLISQGLLQIPALRSLLTQVDSLEGVRFESS